jgi:hypothetical protein
VPAADAGLVQVCVAASSLLAPSRNLIDQKATNKICLVSSLSHFGRFLESTGSAMLF